jgi:hypothetical protein
MGNIVNEFVSELLQNKFAENLLELLTVRLYLGRVTCGQYCAFIQDLTTMTKHPDVKKRFELEIRLVLLLIYSLKPDPVQASETDFDGPLPQARDPPAGGIKTGCAAQ